MSWALVGDMNDAPVNVIKTKTATLIPTRIFVSEISEDRLPGATTEGIGGGEFSVA
jgi:hypothetical protein